MDEDALSMREPEYDKVTQASLNGIYVKAQEMDRGHNEAPAPSFSPPGAHADAETHESARASDASTHASDVSARASDASTHASDAETHASAHTSDVETQSSDAATRASDAETHASTHASDGD